jgi:predicted alpha/beta-fold hydrolase
MWGKFFRPRDLPTVAEERIPAPDGDLVTLATPLAAQAGPILLILHGLEGGLRSHYVAGIWTTALSRGWRPTVLLFRTCDGRMNQSRRTYHSGETSDLDLAIQHIVASHPGRRIGLLGISLGGNVLLKWLGERGEAVPAEVLAAMAVSTPFDLARCSKAIDTGFARLYQWNFLRSLKTKAEAKLAQYPGICEAEVSSWKTMWEFDHEFTAPLHGFKSAADYYDQSSSLRFVSRIRRPTLLLSAYDDPFYSADVLRDVEEAARTNPAIELEFHQHGGHVGFVGGSPWRPSYYVDQRVGSYFTRFLAETR